MLGATALFVLSTTAAAVISLEVGERRAAVVEVVREDLDVRVETDLGQIDAELLFNWSNYEFIIDRPLAALPPPPGDYCRARWSWARGIGGVDARTTRFRITVEGRSARPVVLDDVRARVLRPKAGLQAGCYSGGAQVSVRQLVLDLDRRDGQVIYQAGPEGQPRPLLFKLSLGEVEIFQVVASTERCDCDWELELRYTVGGQRRTLKN